MLWWPKGKVGGGPCFYPSVAPLGLSAGLVDKDRNLGLPLQRHWQGRQTREFPWLKAGGEEGVQWEQAWGRQALERVGE